MSEIRIRKGYKPPILAVVFVHTSWYPAEILHALYRVIFPLAYCVSFFHKIYSWDKTLKFAHKKTVFHYNGESF